MDIRDWNKFQDYLLNTRKNFWNNDYLSFLIESVWKIDKPVKVIDFGCGYGFMGLILMPLLPQGSTYTGIDIADQLLNTGKKLFEKTDYHSKFIHADLLEYSIQEKYDLAICQSVLRHIPSYSIVLQKMISSVVPGGKVICFEINRRIENSGLYIEGKEESIFLNDENMQKNWREELKKGGRDFMAASKIPMLMEQYGLTDVSVRVNDYVEYISPLQSDYVEHMKVFAQEHDIENCGNGIHALNVRGQLISYGTKE